MIHLLDVSINFVYAFFPGYSEQVPTYKSRPDGEAAPKVKQVCFFSVHLEKDKTRRINSVVQSYLLRNFNGPLFHKGSFA